MKLIKGKINAEFVGTDISSSMIKLAKKKLNDENVEFFVADGFKIPLKNGVGFDIIHLDMVLHHMIGKTRSQSFHIAQKLISTISSLLSSKGKIIVEELNVYSHIAPSITSSIIFHGLKFLNFIKLDISSL